MYSIVLTNGKIINIKATSAEWTEINQMIKLFNNGRMVARINMDNIVGWINADYKIDIESQAESEGGNETDN